MKTCHTLFICTDSVIGYALGTSCAHTRVDLLSTRNTLEARSHLRLSLYSCSRSLVQAYTSFPVLRLLTSVRAAEAVVLEIPTER